MGAFLEHGVYVSIKQYQISHSAKHKKESIQNSIETYICTINCAFIHQICSCYGESSVPRNMTKLCRVRYVELL